MKTLVLYHGGNCYDGWCAAWVLRMAYPDAEFRAVNYGQPPPDVTGYRVVIADFSYPRAAMLQLIQQSRGNLVVLDHHKTAEAELKGIEAECYLDAMERLPTVVFDMIKSGARLAWEHVWDVKHTHLTGIGYDPGGDWNTRATPPWLVRYTEDRDLWRHNLLCSLEINAALRSYPFDFEQWDTLAARDPMGFVLEGAAILRNDRRVVDQHVRHAREVVIAGHKVLAVNATVLMSEIGGALAEGRPFGATYFDGDDGLRRWSLRSREGGVDVSEVAKRFGGGGHARSSGFEHPAPAVLV